MKRKDILVLAKDRGRGAAGFLKEIIIITYFFSSLNLFFAEMAIKILG